MDGDVAIGQVRSVHPGTPRSLPEDIGGPEDRDRVVDAGERGTVPCRRRMPADHRARRKEQSHASTPEPVIERQGRIGVDTLDEATVAPLTQLSPGEEPIGDRVTTDEHPGDETSRHRRSLADAVVFSPACPQAAEVATWAGPQAAEVATLAGSQHGAEALAAGAEDVDRGGCRRRTGYRLAQLGVHHRLRLGRPSR